MTETFLAAPSSEGTSRDYWVQRLRGFSQPTPLLDDAAPGRTSQCTAPTSVDLPTSEQGAALRSAVQSLGIQPSSLLEGAWALVASRHQREPDVLFGSVSLDAPSTLLPAPVSVLPQATAGDWLRAIDADRAQRSQQRPDLQALRAWLEWPDSVPICQTVVAFGGGDATPSEGAPLRLELTPDFEQLCARFDPERLSRDAAERALRHLRAALTALATNPDLALCDVDLSEPKDAELIAGLNAAELDYPSACLHDLIEAQVRRTPQAPAVFSGDRSLSYAELDARANQLAHVLLREGVGRETLVGLCVERSFEMMVALLAILKAGAAYVPLDPDYPAERLEFMLEDTAARLVLAQSRTAPKLPSSFAGRVLLLDDPELTQGAAESPPSVTVSPGDLAYVIYTSGSTGRPKGGMIEHRQLVACLFWMQHHYQLSPADRFLQKTPYSFDASICELFWPLLAGAQIVLAEPGGHKNVEYLIETIQRERITVIDFVPSMLRVFLAHPEATRCSSLRRVTCGGEALTPELMEAFFSKLGASLHNLYGPTEATVNVTYWDCEPGSARVVIGKPVANTQIHILDERLRPLPVGVPGELYIGGAQVGRGYLNRPELTAERFVPDPFSSKPGARLYKTGDLARVTHDQQVEYLGRIDFQVKLRGFRVELGEIEAVLLTHPAVTQAAVALRNDQGDDRLVAYLVGDQAERPTGGELRGWLTRSLPEFMVPAHFVWLVALPINPSGKLDRKALPAPPRERPDTGSPPVPPSTDIERAVCAIFAEVLGFEPIGAEDNFFELGGSSLLAMKVLTRLREQYGLDVPVARFFQHPSARDLDGYLARRSGAAGAQQRTRQRRRTEGADDVAIVGMAGRFPGANDVDAFWSLVKSGEAALHRFSDDELDPSLPKDLVNAPNYVKARGIVEGFDQFDAGFFGITPGEARVLDPQHRLMLEVVWEALEHAGYAPETIDGLVGVYAGVYSNSYLTYHILSRPEYQGPLDDISLLLQNEKDYVATRIAHKLNLRGPAVSVHTACSTSLVAVVEAFWSLRTGQCDVAIAGAASLTCPPRSGYLYQEGAMLSADGYTRSFDADATGTTFNDGVAVVVLKRLADAQADGDTIYGVIRGAAANNDGGNKASFTAPSVEGQATVVRMAQEVAGIDARSIGYVEAHGTATPLGDPIEVEALTEAFRETTQDRQYCAISSVKSNIGHIVSAAGAAGLIKTALCLRDGVIAPTAHFRRPNPKIGFESTPFYVADRLSEWPRGDGPRRAGVSSFGVGGTNAHVVLEEPPAPATTPSVRPCELLLLSARSRDALNQATTNLAEHLRGAGDVALADVAYTLALGRRGFRERRFVVASSHAEAIAQLSEPQRAATRSYDGGRANVAFLFPGQGAQAPNMGLGLYTVDPVFRAVVDDCAERLKPDLGRDLRELLFPADTQTDDAAEALRNTAFTQPALFVVEYAVAQVLLGWGIRPSAMIGHSIGEFVSAVLAGVLSLPDALSLVAARGRLMQDLPGGSMLSVRLPAADLERRLPKDLAIASDNGPSLCVVAGSTEAVAELQRALEAEGTVCRALLTSHAFHSPMMDPVVEPFAEMVGKVRLSAPQVPFVSTLTGTWITEEQACDPRYWAKHLRERVRFREAAAELLKDEHRVLLEVGPRATLTALARQQSKLRDRLVATPTLGDSGSVDGEWKALLAALGQLWSAGVEVDWSNLFADERRRRVPLPTYPFERKRYWLDPLPRSDRPAQALDGNLLPQPAPASNGAGTALPIEPIPTFPMSVPMPESAPAAAGRKDRLVAQLREVFEDISGLEMRDVDVHATFLELGLDSLSLTQVAQQLQKTFRVKITFRELMEAFPSLDRLGDHMDQQLPPDPQAPPAATAAPAAATAPIAAAAPVAVAPAALVPAPIATGPAGDLQRVIDQQLLLMQQQLQLLAGRPASAPAVSAPASVAVAQPQAPAPALQPAAPAAAAAPAAPSNGVDAASSETEYQRTYDVKKAFGAIARINTSGTDDLTPGQRARLDAFIQRYTARTRRSKEYTQEHRSRLSDPRAVTGFRPQLKELVYQIVIERSKGSHMWDLDGNEYIDTLSGFGCNLFGWQPDFVNEAVIRQIDIGHEIGPMTPLAAEVADLICDMTGAERAAFCNTGSEAVMGCMRIARTVTGRDTIAIFNGSYHGIFDEVIVRGTKKLRAVPAAPGILPSTAQNVLVLEYGSPEALEILRARGDELAAIMVEPVQSRRPDLQPRDFLHELRGIADRSGAVYIFDEVITGFRCHPGGAQAYFGVQADLASYGKVIGGGYPFAVIAGKRPYMDALDGGHWQYGDDSKPTVGVTYFAGTFCRHPLALAAAKAALLHLKEQGPRLQETLNAKTSALAAELNAHFEAVGAPLEIRHFASLWKVFWKQEQPYGDLLFYSLREKGIHILDLFPCFLTTAHSDADVAAIVQAFKDAVAELQAAEFLPGRSEPERILFDPKAPPVPGARLGRDRSGNPAWFVPHPQNPSKYVKVDAP